GRHPYIFDTVEKKFYSSGQGYASANSWFQLTQNNMGFYVDLHSPKITTFTLTNSTPIVYKGGLHSESIPAIQDVPLAINIKQHFLNGKDIYFGDVNNDTLNPKLTWDGEYIRGLFNNEDMFLYPNLMDKTPASKMQIRVYYGDNRRFADLFYITPTNVNDAPILTSTVDTEYLQKGVLYAGHLGEIVRDPDRELVRYSYINVPNGLIGDETGLFKGMVQTKGRYTMTVKATDDMGASLTFDVNFVVNDTGEPDKPSGGTIDFSLLILLLAAYSRRIYQRLYSVRE
ncbi:MAG: putative Ig domain-containing protein, partial [Shewanella sp.]